MIKFLIFNIIFIGSSIIKIKNKKRITIGLLIDWSNYPYQNAIFTGITDSAEKHDINLFCFEGGRPNSPREFEFQRKTIYKLVPDNLIDGLIILTVSIGHYMNHDEIIDFVNNYKKFPIVSIGYEIKNKISLNIDNKKGFKDLLNHLIKDHGYKNFAFIKGTPVLPDAKERLEIFKNVLKDNNININEDLIIDGDFEIISGVNAVKKLLDKIKIKPDVIVAANDYMAVGAINELNRRKIKVPQDIAVTGFDNIDLSKYINPSLTTVNQPLYDIGIKSVKLILDQINKKKTDKEYILKTNLIIRESCGCIFQYLNTSKQKNDNEKNVKLLLSNKNNEKDQLKKIIKKELNNDIEKYLLIKIDKMINDVIDNFLKCLTMKNDIEYFNSFNKLIDYLFINNNDFYYFTKIIYFIRNSIVKNIDDIDKKSYLEEICNESSKIISKKTIQKEKYINSLILKDNDALTLISQELLVKTDIKEQIDLLILRLKEIGIKSYYTFLYINSKDNNQKKSKLLFACIDDKIIKYDNNNEIIFDANKLIKKELLPKKKRYSYIVEGLKNFGYIIFEISNYYEKNIYSSLSEIIQSSFHNALLFKETNEQKDILANNVKIMRKAMSGFIETMVLTVEKRDPYTAGHQRRVSDLARSIAMQMKLSKNQIESIRMAGIVHDFGKIYIPAEILNKPGKLLDVEFDFIKSHPKVAYDILINVDFPWPIADIVLQHHERLNGSGYPQGLTEKDISIEAKILSVADVVEAMASNRPYRPALGIDIALEEIKKNKGLLYDPETVDICLKLFLEDQYSFKY